MACSIEEPYAKKETLLKKNKSMKIPQRNLLTANQNSR